MESIVHGMHCPNCGNHQFEFIKGTLNHYICTMCAGELEITSADQSYRNVTQETLQDRAFLELKNRQFSEAIITFNKLIDRAPKYSRAYFGKCLAENRCVDEKDLYGSDMTQRYLSKIRNDNRCRFSLSYARAKDVALDFLGINWKNACTFATPSDTNYYNDILDRIINKIFQEYNKILLDRKSKEYKILLELFIKDLSRQELEQLERRFIGLGGFAESIEYAKKCHQRYLAIIEREKIMAQAIARKEKNREITRKTCIFVIIASYIFSVASAISADSMIGLIISVITLTLCSSILNAMKYEDEEYLDYSEIFLVCFGNILLALDIFLTVLVLTFVTDGFFSAFLLILVGIIFFLIFFVVVQIPSNLISFALCLIIIRVKKKQNEKMLQKVESLVNEKVGEL